jgi:hypothetical protein
MPSIAISSSVRINPAEVLSGAEPCRNVDEEAIDDEAEFEMGGGVERYAGLTGVA